MGAEFSAPIFTKQSNVWNVPESENKFIYAPKCDITCTEPIVNQIKIVQYATLKSSELEERCRK